MGFSFCRIRAGLKSYEPGHLALLRFLVASLFYCFTVHIKVRMPDRKDIPMLLVIGLFTITIYHALLSYGE